MRSLAVWLRSAAVSTTLQVRVVLALQDRELLIRTEKGLLGAFGVMIEPILLVITLLAMRILLRFKTTDLINPVIWLGSGVCLFYLFTEVGLKSLNGVKKSQDVFFYRRIRPLDTLLATCLVEARVYGSVLSLLILSVWTWTWHVEFDSPGEAVIVLIFTVLLALGIGISSLVIGHRLPWVKLIVRFGIRRLLLWTSGIFFALYTLPGPVRPFLTWNPLLHAVELFRHSINSAYPIPDISMTYLVAFASISCGFGLLFYSVSESFLLSDE
jgi:capsular polysaccharide transport system permease protein